MLDIASLDDFREFNERARLMFDTAPMIIQYWDKMYNLIDCNKTTLEFYGFSNKEAYIKNFRSLVPERQPDGTPSMEAWDNYLEQVFISGAGNIEYLETALGGVDAFFEVKGVRTIYNNETVVITYSTDVTQLKVAEKHEQESSDMVELLLDSSPALIEIWDDQLNLVDCNNQTAKLLGISDKTEFLEHYEKFSPEFQPCGTPSKVKSVAYAEQALREGSSRFEWTHLTTSGEELPVEVLFVRQKRNGKNIVVGYSHDLRPIKKALAEMQRIEIAEESNRAKSRFLARMSHELRTPITAVLGISEIELQTPDLSPHMEESFAKIHSSANMLLNIVNDVLDLSKIEAGKMELLQDEYDVASIIGDVAQMHLNHLSNKDITFHLCVDENLPAHLSGDILRIEQIMNNLLSNAFKYTDSGSVELSWGCLAHESKEGYIRLTISVSDTGFGLTPEQLGNMGDEYLRFHEHEERFISGTGLGIPIVYSLLRLMDADIDVESEVGKGTKILVSIPQKLTANPETLGKESVSRLQQFELSAKLASKKFSFNPEPMPYGSVLVVDDVDANIYVAKGLLAFYDLKVETCTSGHEAIEKIKQGAVYDIIFMDHMMPGLSGFEAMHIIREMGYAHPIVALTANALIGQAEKFIRAGFDGYISKPIQTKRLNTILIRHIKDKQPPEVIEAANANRTSTKGDINSYQSNPELIAKLRIDFVRHHKNAFIEMCNAIDTGDTETAHRLAHTIKGSAGLILESALARTAEKVEQVLAEAAAPTDSQLSALEREFVRVLLDIGEVEAAPSDSEGYLSSGEAARQGESDVRKNSILIVDDEAMNIRALMDILSDDYVVYAERDGTKCIEAVKRISPDLVLLDVIMPETNGFEIIKELKKDAGTKDVPIIFVTGKNSPEDEFLGFSLGAVDYINKPFNAPVVQMRVQSQMKIINLIRKMHSQTATDTLTGIGNRRFFNTLLHQEWARAKRQQTPISIMILDLDNFKNFNDTYGHLSGDTALVNIARVIASVLVRATDKVARWGGEEFVIILPDIALPGARKVAESIRAAIESDPIPISEGTSVIVTASIGIHCSIPQRTGDYSIDEFMIDADKALYQAKKNGKNCVCAVEDLR
ncbi:MAG: diguanylate cyclase [Oscillospiraceae bacterium]|nr:diguanylate cyclase [Oscillospiraceae bacterium]MCL2227476.1 diguanylate cyclase [Oscillospiraceae bacterium]